jgi:prolyl 4-hydroxylase
MNDAPSLARSMAEAGQAAEAVALLEEESAEGNPEAAAELGLWLLRGDRVERDVPRARTFLGRAATLGSEQALLLEIAFRANGSGARPDWEAALSLLREGARQHAYLADELALVESLDLDVGGYPKATPEGAMLHPGVKLIHFPSFLTPGECQHIANVAVSTLTPSTVFDPASGRQVANPVRTSDGTVVGPAQEDLVVQAVLRRVASATQTDLAQGESLSVLRYAPGQEYRPHFDALARTSNNRIKTVLMYLNDSYTGGETAFPELGLVFAARAGDALAFDGLLPDGSVNLLSRHAGLPVTRGTKWVATRWIRERPFDPWTAAREE